MTRAALTRPTWSNSVGLRLESGPPGAVDREDYRDGFMSMGGAD
jgi:hypothetical protein